MRQHLIYLSIFLFPFFNLYSQDLDSNKYKDHYYMTELKAPPIVGGIAAEYTFSNPGNINKKRKPLIMLGLGVVNNFEFSGYGSIGVGYVNPRPNKKAMISTKISHLLTLKSDALNYWILDIGFRYVRESGFFFQFSPGLFLATYDFGEISFYPLPILSAGVGFTFRRFSETGQ